MARKIVLVVVLACAVSASAAVTGFDLSVATGTFNGLGQLEVAPGSTTAIDLYTIGTGSDGGGLSAIFTVLPIDWKITAAQANEIGGVYDNTNNLNPFVEIAGDGSAAAALIFGNGSLTLADHALVARVWVTAPAALGSVGTVRSNDSVGDLGQTDLAGTSSSPSLTQDTIQLVTTPEPVSALLLLAGLPLLRRRRA